MGGGTSVKPNVAHSLPLEGKVVSARIPDEVFRSVLVYKAGGASPSPTEVGGEFSYPCRGVHCTSATCGFYLQGGRSKPLPYRDKRMVVLPLVGVCIARPQRAVLVL